GLPARAAAPGEKGTEDAVSLGHRSAYPAESGETMSDAHMFADQEDAAERYLLGQMSDADRDAFEEHFFQCVECAQEVKATAQFLDSCRDAIADQAIADRFAPRLDRRPAMPR